MNSINKTRFQQDREIELLQDEVDRLRQRLRVASKITGELRNAANLILDKWETIPSGIQPSELFLAAKLLADHYAKTNPNEVGNSE